MAIRPTVCNFILSALVPKASGKSCTDILAVPTTSIYSATDEIVSPQTGEWASALMKDVRGVGVFNCELQRVAPFTPAVGNLFILLIP